MRDVILLIHITEPVMKQWKFHRPWEWESSFRMRTQKKKSRIWDYGKFKRFYKAKETTTGVKRYLQERAKNIAKYIFGKE